MNDNFDFCLVDKCYIENTNIELKTDSNKETKKVFSKDMEDLITFRRYLDELISNRENAVVELASKIRR